MITVNYGAIERYRKGLSIRVALEFAKLNVQYRQTLSQMFGELVEGTPQWSGDLASNWNFSVGKPDETYRELPTKSDSWRDRDFTPRAIGDPAAVGVAMARMRPILDTVSWRDRVYFTNATPIADEVEAQTIYIRPVNLVNGGVAMISHLHYKYGGQV